MKIKITKLTGAALDWAVAKCEGVDVNFLVAHQYGGEHFYQYRSNWLSAGPIIEKELITLKPFSGAWLACIWNEDNDEPHRKFYRGPTVLVAAMRCYVASKLGDEIEVPDNLKGE